MNDEEVLVPISAIEHWEYCPRQCLLIHGDGVWSDNAHTVRGRRSHRRADSGETRVERGRTALRSIPLWSESLGLTGRADVVEVSADGSIEPIEYKSGSRHGRTADLQVCAQAICLEEMFDVKVDRGWIWYGSTRRRHRVEFDSQLRSDVVADVEAIRARLQSGDLPPAVDDSRCAECQLLNYCVPTVCSKAPSLVTYVKEEVFGEAPQHGVRA